MRETVSHRTRDWGLGIRERCLLSCFAFLLVAAIFHRGYGGAFGDRFFQADFEALASDTETQAAVDAHQMIRHPHDGKPGHDISAPVVEQEREAAEKEHHGRHVVAETICAGEQKEELACAEPARALGPIHTVVAAFTEQLFVGHRPGDRRDRKRQNQQRQQIGAGNMSHAATRRAARLLTLISNLRTRSRAIVKYSETASPIASTSSRTTINSVPMVENISIAVRFLVITPNPNECRSDTLSKR